MMTGDDNTQTLGEQIDGITERVTEIVSELDAKTQQLAAIAKAFEPLRATFVPFNSAKQEFFCRVCRYRDPLGPDGTKLHDDNCPMLAMLEALEGGR